MRTCLASLGACNVCVLSEPSYFCSPLQVSPCMLFWQAAAVSAIICGVHAALCCVFGMSHVCLCDTASTCILYTTVFPSCGGRHASPPGSRGREQV